MERNEAIAQIKSALKARSGKTWSVKGGTGTAWGWITVSAPPARLVDGWKLSDTDKAELSALLGEQMGNQGVVIPASSQYRVEYVAKAQGVTPIRTGTPYWD